MTAIEREIERLIQEVEKKWSDERAAKSLARAATRPQAGPGEAAVRSQPATSPPAGAGAPPQRFPAAPRVAVQEALMLVNATALRLARRWGRDPGQLADELAVRTDELVGRVKLPFDRALEQVAREVDADFAQGRR
jgi:hypothetical protein